MRFSAAQKNRLYGEIAKLLRAGFSIDDAAAAILERRPATIARRYLEGLREGLAERHSIGESVGRIPIDLTPLEVSIVEAGERGGRLEDAYEHLAAYFHTVDRTRKRIQASLIYPLILLHVAIILPAIPKALFAGDVALAYRPIITSLLALYFLAAAALIGGRWLGRIARQDARIDGVLAAIPIAGKARRSLALGRFCKVFHIHLLAALPITTGLRAGGEAAQSGRLRGGSARAAERIESGGSLSEAIRDEPSFPPELAASLSTAELSGTLDEDLARWARLYHDSATDALDAVSGWFPRVLYVLVVVYVVWQILSMGLAYLGVLEGYLGP